MDQQTPPAPSAAASPVAAFDQAYFKLRGTYAEALSRATTDEEQRILRDRVLRIIRFRELLNLTDRSEVLAAITAVRADQETAAAYIATQIATRPRSTTS